MCDNPKDKVLYRAYLRLGKAIDDAMNDPKVIGTSPANVSPRSKKYRDGRPEGIDVYLTLDRIRDAYRHLGLCQPIFGIELGKEPHEKKEP